MVSTLFEMTQTVYLKYFKKNTAWAINKKQLLDYPKSTLGYNLGRFLEKQGFDIIPKAERHDVYHVLTGYSIREQDEVALQYLCYGNGKRSIYGLGVILVGSMLLPEYLKYYIQSYKRGQSAKAFHDLDFKPLLGHSLSDLKGQLFDSKS